MKNRLRPLSSLLRRPPRQLRFTREGKVLVGIALAVGGAAINTGHNLLYFGWGLILAAIVISGVLSELSLQALRVVPRRPEELRAGALSPLPLVVTNPRRRLPSLGLELDLRLERRSTAADELIVKAPYLLRLDPGAEAELLATSRPRRRGVYLVTEARARTTYPFGFFEKTRPIVFDSPVEVEVFPARIELPGVTRSLLSRLGDVPAGQRGPGDDFYSLRPFAHGDDPRAVHWRRSARTGRLVTKETEVQGAREVVLELPFPSVLPPAARGAGLTEHVLACVGSLLEDLLSAGVAVGLRTAGVDLPPATGPRQRACVLSALARVQPTAPLPELGGSARRAARLGVVAPGWPAPVHVDHLIELPPPAEPEGASPPASTRSAA
ncbi:MAG: DUF58 domain-containing protein [Myxococcota bacterium]